eukprot:1837880-Amphidinium_carterae.1
MRTLKIPGHEVIQLRTQRSLWAVVAEGTQQKVEGELNDAGEIVSPEGQILGFFRRIFPCVVALVGIYVDDIIGAGTESVVSLVVGQIRTWWKT